MAVALINAQMGNPAPGGAIPPPAPGVGASPLTAVPNPSANPVEAQIRSGLARYIRSCFDDAKRHRETEGIDDRMISALRTMRGEYDPAILQDIKRYGGSEVYARLTASKVRAVAAMLREIYSAEERPWMLSPTPDPELAGPSLAEAVREVMKAEIQEMLINGQQVTDELLQQRLTELRSELLDMRKKVARDGLSLRENAIDDLLWEGGFYKALQEVLLDVATFPFGVIKGPIVERKRAVAWEGNKPVVKDKPTMNWVRCSPFDVYCAPWSQSPQDGYIIHRMRATRGSLQALRGLASYDTSAIDRVLSRGKGYDSTWVSYTESDRANLEQRESDTAHSSTTAHADRPMPMLEFHGPISGELLLEWGMKKAQVPDADRDIDVVAYLINDEVIGVRTNPHPAGFKPFYFDSFESVPGSLYGHGVPDLIADIQNVGNAALRAMVNNLAMSSGPMVYVDGDRMAENDPDPTKIWPWKVYYGQNSALSPNTSQPPVVFFQPESNAEELLRVYEAMARMADDLSSVPRHMSGSTQGLQGAGRTAAGLSMMMEAGGRTLKMAVSAIDQGIIEPVIEHLNIYLALLRPDVVMEGDISVVARGAAELVQRETLRMRKLEFLQITNNPIDQALVGPVGRFNVLKDVAKDLGMPISDILPNKPPEGMPLPPAGPQQGQQVAVGEDPAAPTDGIAQPPATA